MMMKQYAFLNCIYVNANGESVLYEIVFSNNDYTNISIYRTNLSGLIELSKDEGLIRDFYFSDGYLRCSPELPHVLINSDVALADGIENVYVEIPDESILSLLRVGVNNGFYLLDDRVCENDSWVGDGITRFSKIRFSQSSMSAYARMVFGDEYFNKYIITIEENMLKVQPFKFAVPTQFTGTLSSCTKIKQMNINNQIYDVWQTNSNLIMREVPVLSAPLINKAATTSVKLKSLGSVYATLMDLLLSDRKQLVWVDTRPQRSAKPLGITFVNSYKKWNTAMVDTVIQSFKRLNRQDDDSIFLEMLNDEYSDDLIRIAIKSLREISKAAKNETELTMLLKSHLDDVDTMLFNADFFLYCIRVYVYYTGAKLTLREPILYGSNEVNSFTVVKEVLLDV